MPETIVLKPIIIKAWEDSSPGNSFTGWAGSRQGEVRAWNDTYDSRTTG